MPRADGLVAEAAVEATCAGVGFVHVEADAVFAVCQRHFGQGLQQRRADATPALLRCDGEGIEIPLVREGFEVGKEAVRRVKAMLLQHHAEGLVNLRFVFAGVAEGGAGDTTIADVDDTARVAVAVAGMGDGAGEQGARGFQTVTGEEGQFHRFQYGQDDGGEGGGVFGAGGADGHNQCGLCCASCASRSFCGVTSLPSLSTMRVASRCPSTWPRMAARYSRRKRSRSAVSSAVRERFLAMCASSLMRFRTGMVIGCSFNYGM